MNLMKCQWVCIHWELLSSLKSWPASVKDLQLLVSNFTVNCSFSSLLDDIRNHHTWISNFCFHSVEYDQKRWKSGFGSTHLCHCQLLIMYMNRVLVKGLYWLAIPFRNMVLLASWIPPVLELNEQVQSPGHERQHYFQGFSQMNGSFHFIYGLFEEADHTPNSWHTRICLGLHLPAHLLRSYLPSRYVQVFSSTSSKLLELIQVMQGLVKITVYIVYPGSIISKVGLLTLIRVHLLYTYQLTFWTLEIELQTVLLQGTAATQLCVVAIFNYKPCLVKTQLFQNHW